MDEIKQMTMFFTKKINKNNNKIPEKKHQRKNIFHRKKLAWRMFGQNLGQHSFWDLYHTWYLKDEG